MNFLKNIMNMDIVKQIMDMQIVKFAFKHKFTILVTIVAFNIFLLALFIIYRMRITKKVEGYTSSNTVNLVMLHVDWCPHCKTAKPAWDKITKNYHGVSINNKKVNVFSIDSTDENSMVSAYGKTVENVLSQFKKNNSPYKVEGYPTILLTDDKHNIIAEFEQNTSYENLENFINNNV